MASVATVTGFYYNGSDYSTFKPDGTSGLTFTVIKDPKQVVAQHILRRWILEQGQLDVTFIGVGIRRYLNMSLTTVQRDQLEAELRASALDVDGVQNISLTLSSKQLPGAGTEFTIRATVSLTRKFGEQTFDTVFVLTTTTARYIVEGLIT